MRNPYPVNGIAHEQYSYFQGLFKRRTEEEIEKVYAKAEMAVNYFTGKEGCEQSLLNYQNESDMIWMAAFDTGIVL